MGKDKRYTDQVQAAREQSNNVVMSERFSKAGHKLIEDASLTRKDDFSEPDPPQHRAVARSVVEHARVLLDYLIELRRNDSCVDVRVLSTGQLICRAHKIVVAAFSDHFKEAMTDLQNELSIDLDVNPHVTGVGWEEIEEVIEFFYSGECRYSTKLLAAARFLKCYSLIDLLERAQAEGATDASGGHSFSIVDDHHAVHLLNNLYRLRLDNLYLDCILVPIEPTHKPIKCHRLVLAAYAHRIERSLRETTGTISPLKLVLGKQFRATLLNLMCIVDYIYMGYVRTLRRRFRIVRHTADFLGMQRMVADINALLENNLGLDDGVEYSVPERQDGMGMEHSDEDFGMTAGLQAGEYEYYESGEHSANAQFEEEHGIEEAEYSQIYEEFVVGPRKVKRNRTPRRIAHLRAKGNPVMVNTRMVESDPASTEAVPVLQMSCVPAGQRRNRVLDSFGYGLPEIHGVKEVAVPLVVGDQREMMEKPYKCPYCPHRTKEKSAVDKHVRSIHTNEAPYKCKYCGMAFKVQCNMVRHIRAHTGEKPYACRKCGLCYADKKNMDAHIFREHLKMQQFVCEVDGCSARFWRYDRFVNHYYKVHGISPPASYKRQQLLHQQQQHLAESDQRSAHFLETGDLHGEGGPDEGMGGRASGSRSILY